MSSFYDLGILDSITDQPIQDILDSWTAFCATTEALIQEKGHLSLESDFFISHVHRLCHRRLASLVEDHFLQALQRVFQKNGASKFWQHFTATPNHSIQEDWAQQVLCKALEDICLEKQYQEKCLLILVHALQSYNDCTSEGRHISGEDKVRLLSKYQLMVSSVLMTSLPRHFPGILRLYFKGRLEELSNMMIGDNEVVNESKYKDEMDLDERSKRPSRVGEMDIDSTYDGKITSENNKLVKSIGKVVQNLRSLQFTAMTEDAYASAIFFLLKTKVHDLAGDDYRNSVLESIKEWIQ